MFRLKIVTVVIVLLCAIIRCENKNNTSNALAVEPAKKDQIILNYVYVKNLQQDGHPEIYQNNEKTDIIKKVHELVVCGDKSNISSSEVLEGFVRVSCLQSIWGSVIEGQLQASIENSTEYDAESETFEDNRSINSLVKLDGKIIIIGTESGDDPSVLGVASSIPNLVSDPAVLRSIGMPVRDLTTGEIFHTKNLTGLRYDIVNFFKDEGDPSLKLSIQTAQHELGHLFGLFHTFQFYGTNHVHYNDLIEDTPVHDVGDCSDPLVNENIMSYCQGEKELRFFTEGQISRMNEVINSP